MEVSNRMVKEAPNAAPGAVLILMVLLLRDGLVPPLLRWGQGQPYIGLGVCCCPQVVVFYGLQVLCRQADVCWLWV